MSSDGLKFELRFSSGSKVTSAAFAVRVNGEPVWPVAGALEEFLDIQVDDILSHLVECWLPLTLRQTYPITVAPTRPLGLRAEAEKRWEQQPAEVAEREDEIISDFEDVHNLSECFAGYFELPPLWLMRRGGKMIVDTRAGAKAVEFPQAWIEMVRLGDEIAEHLRKFGARWSLLIERWRDRDQHDPLTLLSWSTSLDRDVAERFVAEGILSAPGNLAIAVNDNDELRVAARMASALPAHQIRNILDIVKSFEKASAPKLDRLAAATTEYIEAHFFGRRAYEQGETAASFVRGELGVYPYQYFDIGAGLQQFGVKIHTRAFEPATLRALAIWGSNHGPSVFINLKGRLGGSDRNPLSYWSSRVDMAHELCHLLLDRGHALGAVEILNSRMPTDVEQRAKSFAGELLLPTAAAAEEWRGFGSPTSLRELKTLIFVLQEKYGVPKPVASWKLQHATQTSDVDISVILEAIAPER